MKSVKSEAGPIPNIALQTSEPDHLRSRSSRGHKLAVLASLVFSAALLAYLFKDVNRALFFQALREVRWIYIPGLAILIYMAFIMRGLRWRLLLPSDRPLSTRRLIDATAFGCFASCILPLRAGEFLRPLVLSRWEPVSFALAFASVVTERVFDLLAMFTMLGLVLITVPGIPPGVVAGAKGLGVVAGLVLLSMVVAYSRPSYVLGPLSWVLRTARITPSLRAFVLRHAEEFVQGLRAIASYRELAGVIIWSLAIWLQYAFVFQYGMWCFGQFPPWSLGLLVNVMVALAVAMPSAPGFLGTFQLGCVLGLTTVSGYPEEFSLAYSLVLHVVQTAVTVGAGALVLNSAGLRFRDLQSAADSRH